LAAKRTCIYGVSIPLVHTRMQDVRVNENILIYR
jgi:hypothetical protein